MTDVDADRQAQLDRIAALRRSRPPAEAATAPVADAVASPPARRSHPALGSRIASVGLGVSATFAIMALLGLEAADDTPAPSPAPLSAPTSVAPVVVVVHSGSTVAATPTAPSDAATALTPIELVATPVVRVVAAPDAPAASPSAPAAPTPVAAPIPEATTSGSN